MVGANCICNQFFCNCLQNRDVARIASIYYIIWYLIHPIIEKFGRNWSRFKMAWYHNFRAGYCEVKLYHCQLGSHVLTIHDKNVGQRITKTPFYNEMKASVKAPTVSMNDLVIVHGGSFSIISTQNINPIMKSEDDFVTWFLEIL